MGFMCMFRGETTEKVHKWGKLRDGHVGVDLIIPQDA